MDAIVHDLLLFFSLVAAPIILGFLLYLGLQISEGDDAESVHRSGQGRKPPGQFWRERRQSQRNRMTHNAL